MITLYGQLSPGACHVVRVVKNCVTETRPFLVKALEGSTEDRQGEIAVSAADPTFRRPGLRFYSFLVFGLTYTNQSAGLGSLEFNPMTGCTLRCRIRSKC